MKRNAPDPKKSDKKVAEQCLNEIQKIMTTKEGKESMDFFLPILKDKGQFKADIRGKHSQFNEKSRDERIKFTLFGKLKPFSQMAEQNLNFEKCGKPELYQQFTGGKHPSQIAISTLIFYQEYTKYREEDKKYEVNLLAHLDKEEDENGGDKYHTLQTERLESMAQALVCIYKEKKGLVGFFKSGF